MSSSSPQVKRMMKIGANDFCFTEPSHTHPFLMTVEEEGNIDVDDRLLCLHFNIEHGPLVLVEREEFDEDMVLMRTVYQRPRYSDVEVFYQVTPGYYKVQWVGGSEIPSASLNIVGSRAASNLWRSHTTQSKGKLPTVPESPKVDIGKVEVLCLSSDSDSPCDEGSDAEGLPSSVTAKPFASSSCDRDYHFDDDCSPLPNKSILSEVVKATYLGDPLKCGGSSQATASRSGSTDVLKTRDSGSLAFHGSPSVGDKSKILSPMTPETPLNHSLSLGALHSQSCWDYILCNSLRMVLRRAPQKASCCCYFEWVVISRAGVY